MKNIIFAVMMGVATLVSMVSCKKDVEVLKPLPVVGFEVKNMYSSIYSQKFEISIIANISTDQSIGINKAVSIEDFSLFSNEEIVYDYYIKKLKVNGVDLKYDEVYFTLDSSENRVEFIIEFQKNEDQEINSLFWVEMSRFSYLYQGDVYVKAFEEKVITDSILIE